jgi:hypothetical protein
VIEPRDSLLAETDGQTIGVIVTSRMDTVLPKQGPTDGADSMPE